LVGSLISFLLVKVLSLLLVDQFGM
jgi:hypothetical protein